MLFLVNCTNPDILRVIYFGKLVLQVLLIAIPIALIVMLIIDISKGMMDGDEKNKNMNMAIKRILMVVLLFLVPTITNACMHLLTVAGIEWTSCYDYANPEQINLFTEIQNNQKAEEKAKKDLEREQAIADAKTPTNSGIKYNTVGDSNNSSSNSTTEKETGNYTIHVGDSRTKGMCDSVTKSQNEDCTIASVGKGYSWFADTAVPSLKELLKEHPKSNVLIDMGTNDLYDPAAVDAKKVANNYAWKYNTLAKEYPDAKFIIVSVNPVDNKVASAASYKITDELIVEFNNALKSKLDSSVKYCDVYSQIKSTFVPEGGIHYTADTYKKIYELENKCL